MRYLRAWLLGSLLLAATLAGAPAAVGSTGAATPPQINACDMQLARAVAYVADCATGLQIVDLSDPDQQRALGQLALPGGATRIHLADSTALLTRPDAGIEVVDVSAPEAPRRVTTVAVSGGAHDMVAQGGRAYVVAGDNSVLIYDISSPRAPRRIARYQGVGDRLHQLELAGDRLYVSSQKSKSASVVILDVGNLPNIRTLGQLAATEYDFSVDGSRLYIDYCCFTISPHDPGYQHVTNVYDTSNPAAPVWEDMIWDGYWSDRWEGIFLNGRLAYFQSARGMQVYDHGSPDGRRLAVLPYPYIPNRLIIVGTTMYLASSDGLHVLELEPRLTMGQRAFLPLIR